MELKDRLRAGIRDAYAKWLYQGAVNRRAALPLLRRLLAPCPKDPCKGRSFDTLALAYVREFNESVPEYQRNAAVDGNTHHFVGFTLRYQSENTLPVLTITAFDGSCFYEQRWAWQADGSRTDWGCSYPRSECGVSFRWDYAEEKGFYRYADDALALLDKAVREALNDLI